jgi:hypothetical protein
MKPPKKWKPGDERIITFMAFEDAVKAGRMLFVRQNFQSKPVSARFVFRMSYQMVAHLIYNQSMTFAVHTDEYRDWLRKEMLGKDGGG